MTVEERFWSRVKKTDECWEWQAGKSTGYGIFRYGGRDGKAHRFAYELLVGSIPNGLELDHLCRNRGCVNPAHLEPVTTRENILRGEGMGARYARRDYCKHGHGFTPENTAPLAGGGRRCRACHKARGFAYRQRHAERLNAQARERYGANPEPTLERQRKYHQENREKILARTRASREANREEWRTYMREYMRTYRARKRATA